MERDLETGEPTGVFYGQGDFLSSLIPPLDKGQLDQGVKLANQELVKAGITSFQDASSRNDLERWLSFEGWKANGFLDCRVVMMLGWKGFEEYQSDQFPVLKDKNQLKPGGVKIVLDETTGKLFPTQNDLKEIVLSVHKAGQQAAIHALEETAIEAACSAIEQAQRIYPRKDLRHRIEHCSVCPPALSERIASLGAMVVSNPAFIYFSGERYLKTVDPSQLEIFVSFRQPDKNRRFFSRWFGCPDCPGQPSGRDLWGGYPEVEKRRDRFGKREDRGL